MKFWKPHKLKRILSCLSALVITTSLAGVLPAYADDEITPYPYTIFAGSNEEGAISSTAATLCINGNIATNGTLSIGSNVNVNGTKTEHAQEAMPIIFNQIDDRFFSENNEMHDEDYSFSDTNICVINPVEVQGQLAYDGNIAISAGIKALNDITLTGEVLNTNNSVICSQTGDITIDSTNVSLNGLYYAPYGTVSLKAQNLNLNNVVIIADKINIDAQNVNVNYNLSMAQFVGEAIELSNNGHESNDDIDPFIYAFGAYNKENNSIDISWYTNISGEFEILESDNNESFVSLDLISDTTAFVYNISNDFDTKYFKVKGISGSKTTESIPFVVKKVEDQYNVDYLDSDKDGLYDIYECFLGTDINNSDTDNDGLTDYQEFFMTGTDPTIYDSVIEGVSDYYIDSDDDGLINGIELETGTEPQNSDSDYDGLNDGDEVNSYNTDPLNADSDGDTLSDGDEPRIGLDPANPRTFGTPDEEYVTEQNISAQSDAFSKINTDENPYELSMKYTGTGYAESNITVEKSGYANAIESNMELGTIAEFSFENSCKMEKAVLYYSIKNDYINNELGKYALNNEELVGIKRLGVFTYNEENHILVPLVTEYDVENNTVYAEVNAAGTYFLVDYEKWFDEWGISAETSSNPTRLMAKASTVNEVSTKNERIDKADIVFSIDISGTSSNKLGETPEQNLARAKNDILTVAEKIYKKGEDVRFGVFGFTWRYSVSEIGYRTYLDNGSEWATNLEELEYLLNQLYIDPYYQRAYIECGIQDAASPIATGIEQYQYRDDADKYLFEYAPLGDLNFFDSSYVLSELCSYPALYDQLERSGIRFSYVIDKAVYYTIFEQAAYQTGGQTAFYCLDSVTDDISDFIYDTAKKVKIIDIKPSPTYISSLSLKSITLNEPLSFGNKTDSDTDCLTDWEEVDSDNSLITYEFGDIHLPTYEKCLKACGGSYYDFDKVMNVIKDRFGIVIEQQLFGKMVLPLDSDPTEKDTDWDGIIDSNDNDPRNNSFEKVLNKAYKIDNSNYDTVISDVKYSFSLKDFFKSNIKYNSNLSTFSLLLSSVIYCNSYICERDYPYQGDDANQMLVKHGFNHVQTYWLEKGAPEYSIERYKGDLNNKDDLKDLDHHISQICIGHQEVTFNGHTKDIVAIVVRGTNGTITEWTSNMDIGSTEQRDMYLTYKRTGQMSQFGYTMNYLYENNRNEFNAFEDWMTAENHKGFDIATSRILKYVNAYIEDKHLNRERITYWVTGHSRGGAIANLLSAYLIDEGNEVFAYTFAAPNTTTNEKSHDEKYWSIFNIINKDDFVPMLPTEEWGFRKYGRNKEQNVSKYKDAWDNWMIYNIEDYNGNLKSYNKYMYDSSLESTIHKIAELTHDRNECYTKNNIVDIAYISVSDIYENARPYIGIISIYTPNGATKRVFEPPIYYFQILADVMAEANGAIVEFASFITHDAYAVVTLSLYLSQRNHQLEIPHYLQSYYLLSKILD